MRSLAEGYLRIEREEDFETAEADIKTKYTWGAVTEKHFVKNGRFWILYAQGA